MSFRERDEVLESLYNVLSDENEVTAEKLAPFCRINHHVPSSDMPDTFSGTLENKNLFNLFKVYATQKDKFLSRLEMVVKGEDNRMIPEDFFSLQMTIIFPSWPARFQDKNFREAAENLFRLNSPAHLKINFIWMNVLSLRQFEAAERG